MENKPEQRAWYESEIVRDQISALKGRAPMGLMAAFRTGHILYSHRALDQITSFLKSKLEREERRVLIIVDDFTEKFASKVIKTLEPIEAESLVWAGVEPEGPLNTIEEGVKICKEFNPRVFIALGGGSVIDTAKALMIKYEKPETSLYRVTPFESLGLRKKVKFLIAIPTTSGTGSEVTYSAMLTDINRDPPQKLTIAHPELIPDLVILHTEFVKDMPPFLTMATGLDALAHSVGSYVSTWGSPLTDSINIYAIKEILKYLPRAYKYGGKDLEARSHMQLAATMAGLGFGNSRVGLDHALAHSFGKIFMVHHGLCVGMFLVYTTAFLAKVSDRWKDLCFLFNIESKGKNEKELFSEFIQAIKNFISSLDGPLCVKDLKNPVISKEDYFKNLDLLVKYTELDAVSLLSPRYLNKEVLEKIFVYAWDGKDIDF